MRTFWGERLSIGLLGACALLLAALATGCGSGGSSDSNAAATVEKPAAPTGPTEASLHAVGGSGVSGKIVYVEKAPEIPLMKIRLQGVRKATGEAQYFIWQRESRHDMVSFASYHVPHGSTLSIDLEPNPESLVWLEEGSTTKVLITRIENDDRYFASQEHWPSGSDPTDIGVPVAEGVFKGPLVGAGAG